MATFDDPSVLLNSVSYSFRNPQKDRKAHLLNPLFYFLTFFGALIDHEGWKLPPLYLGHFQLTMGMPQCLIVYNVSKSRGINDG